MTARKVQGHGASGGGRNAGAASRRALLAGSAAWAFVAPLRAQRTAKTARVGFLAPPVGDVAGRELFSLLHAEMERLGWAEGSRVEYVVRVPGEFTTAEETGAQIAKMVQELIFAKVDLIVTMSTRGAVAAKSATATIPIVFLAERPVENGLVATLARPGGNASGVTYHIGSLAAKRVQLLKQAFPEIRRIAFLVPANQPSFDLGAARALERPLGVEVWAVTVAGGEDLERAFAAAPRPDAWVIEDFLAFVPYAERLLQVAASSRKPAMYGDPGWVRDGGLMSYSDDRAEWPRLIAGFADRILRGARPAEMPVEEPTRFTLAINRRTARALGVTIASSVLLQATEVIE